MEVVDMLEVDTLDDAIKALSNPEIKTLDINRSGEKARKKNKKAALENELRDIAAALQKEECQVTTLNIFNKQK